MFLPEESTYGGIPSTSGAIDIENPYLCGFLHSRPGPPMPEKTESRPSRPVAEETGPYEPKTTMEWSISLDPYHHPAKRLDQSIRYLQAFDMYS